MDSTHPLLGQRFHFFGVAGRGMAALAVVTRHLGAEVSGCDRAGIALIHDYLRDARIDYAREHDAAHVRPGTTFVATSAASPDHPEILAAGEGAWHRADLLADVMRRRRSVGVTGSHGKGTVAALASAALTEAGQDPLAIIGVHVGELDGMTRLGDGPIVAEVDDSDLSLTRVTTDVAVVTNLYDDHPHLHIRLREAVQGVGQYVAQARERVILGSSRTARALEEFATAPVWRLGRDFSVRTLSTKAGETRLALRGPGGEREEAVVRLLGPRTDENAALAFASALALGADPAAAAAGLGDVSSMSRRMEHLGAAHGIEVFDDIGKHPVAIRENLRALRRHYPHSRVTAVYEPYVFFLPRWGHRLALALGEADRVVLLPPVTHPDYETPDSLGQGWSRACPVEPLHATDRDDAADTAMRISEPGDVVVFLATLNVSRSMAERAVARADASRGA